MIPKICVAFRSLMMVCIGIDTSEVQAVWTHLVQTFVCLMPYIMTDGGRILATASRNAFSASSHFPLDFCDTEADNVRQPHHFLYLFHVFIIFLVQIE